ncbi:MAG TPA: hypothetical protein VF384_08140 [Planctomycetota bacterium]
MTAAQNRSAGMTLVEVTVVLAIMLPILLVITSATKAVMGSFKATESSSGEMETAQRCVADLDTVFRAGRRRTVEVKATQADVTALRATAIGEWCSMVTADPRTCLRLESTTGEDGPELIVPVRMNELAFVRDAAELADGLDNDGDGLFDEGSLKWTRGGFTSDIARDLEICTFQLDRDSVRVTLQFAVAGHGGTLRRTKLQHTVRLNNP